jgi:hypothetical protein
MSGAWLVSVRFSSSLSQWQKQQQPAGQLAAFITMLKRAFFHKVSPLAIQPFLGNFSVWT